MMVRTLHVYLGQSLVGRLEQDQSGTMRFRYDEAWEGGPTLKKCFELVRAVSSVPGPDVLKLFDAVVFNYLIGNADAHGKNFSFLRGANARLAPLYDLVGTQAYSELSPDMVMKIGGEKKPSRVSQTNWRKFLEDTNFDPAGRPSGVCPRSLAGSSARCKR